MRLYLNQKSLELIGADKNKAHTGLRLAEEVMWLGLEMIFIRRVHWSRPNEIYVVEELLVA